MSTEDDNCGALMASYYKQQRYKQSCCQMETYKATYGAVIGDICGSVYEWQNRKTDKPEEIELINHHCYFTDDTVLTVAVMDALKTDRDYGASLRRWANKYPLAGYGGRFKNWMTAEEPKPYNSYGNGSAMRVSPVVWYPYQKEFADGYLEKRSIHQFILREARRTAECTHNHPEGIRGATEVSTAMFFARFGWDMDHIKMVIEGNSDYNLSRSLAEIRETYTFNETCQGSVPEAIIAFLESYNFESAIQNAISIGGDSDTIACIAGAIAEAYYREIPQRLIDFANERLPDEMKKVLAFDW